MYLTLKCTGSIFSRDVLCHHSHKSLGATRIKSSPNFPVEMLVIFGIVIEKLKFLKL